MQVLLLRIRMRCTWCALSALLLSFGGALVLLCDIMRIFRCFQTGPRKTLGNTGIFPNTQSWIIYSISVSFTPGLHPEHQNVMAQADGLGMMRISWLCWFCEWYHFHGGNWRNMMGTSELLKGAKWVDLSLNDIFMGFSTFRWILHTDFPNVWFVDFVMEKSYAFQIAWYFFPSFQAQNRYISIEMND